MLYYLGILLRHLYYCSIQRLHIRLSCVRWSSTNRVSLIRFCSICPVLVWLNPGKETERRTYVLPGSWMLMRPVYKDCSEREFLLAFTKSLYYRCDSQHIIMFLSWLSIPEQLSVICTDLVQNSSIPLSWRYIIYAHTFVTANTCTYFPCTNTK